jgi:hypothetical protein
MMGPRDVLARGDCRKREKRNATNTNEMKRKEERRKRKRMRKETPVTCVTQINNKE